MTDDEFEKQMKEAFNRRRYIKPKNFKRIENDKEWSNLVGPNFMKQLRKMYEVPEHVHTNGLMSCSTCIYLVFQYEDDLKENEK